MKLQERDVQLVKDIGLSHLLSRDQIIELGYFSSVTRVNSRLRVLAEIDLVRRLDTPFYSQSLYMAGHKASEIVGVRIGKILDKRTSSPRFIRHALSVTNTRIALLKRGAGEWRFEQQTRHTFKYDHPYDIRPDGVVLGKELPILLEVDLGSMSTSKFQEKLKAYRAFVLSGQCQSVYGQPTIRLLVVTTGSKRASSLRRLLPPNAPFQYLVQTFDELGIPTIGGWS